MCELFGMHSIVAVLFEADADDICGFAVYLHLPHCLKKNIALLGVNAARYLPEYV